MTTQKIIEHFNPERILVNSSNYLQCVIEGSLREFQYSYIHKCWYEFKSVGRSDSPNEIFVNFIK